MLMTMATRGLNLRPGTLLRVDLPGSLTLYAEPWGRCTGVITRDELLTVLTALSGEAARSPGLRELPGWHHVLVAAAGSNVGWVNERALSVSTTTVGG